MKITIERYDEMPTLTFEGFNTEEEAVSSVKKMLKGYNTKDFKKVEIDGKDISNKFEEFFQPCPCGCYGDPYKLCLCSYESINRWRKRHNLSEL